MYSKLALFVASAFALGAMAGNAPAVSQCNVGTMHCCNDIQDANSEIAQGVLSTVGVVIGSVTGQVGLGCVAAGVLGLGSNGCNAQPTCCTGNDFSGLVVIGCSPINL